MKARDLIEIADSSQHNTIMELDHVVFRPLDNSRILRSIVSFKVWKRVRSDGALREILDSRCSFCFGTSARMGYGCTPFGQRLTYGGL
jgi:hypothetical protein